MAHVYITFKIMPEDVDIDLKHVETEAVEKIKAYGGNVGKTEVVPVAFGLKSVNVVFSMDEKKGGTEPLEEELKKIKGVQAVEVIDVRRALG